ncbi:hypothetical protein CLOSTMETH_01245 [[Clostridium] methylpentosum DSM 5476]|uniref:Uncharacterized protein n=1 Tax=[Clostridium] methylpentosum DSM 5476 TaxID=537013 RepID=C0EBM7_9FIRM|nr:hypothetical protein CLOSTMETH_01245 [[Clostridium] methylpentosum DSM 5476]
MNRGAKTVGAISAAESIDFPICAGSPELSEQPGQNAGFPVTTVTGFSSVDPNLHQGKRRYFCCHTTLGRLCAGSG